MSEVHIEKPRPPRRAFRFQTPILTSCESCGLFGLFARPAPGARLSLRSQLAEVFRPALRHCAAALAAHDGGGAHALLADKIVNQGEGGAEILTGTRGAVLGKVGSCFEDQIRIGYQVSEGLQ